MTNFERIKGMSVDEMVAFINHETDGICSCCNLYPSKKDRCYEIKGMCERGIKQWLETEVASNDL